MHRYSLGCCPRNHLPWDKFKHLLNIEFVASQYDDFFGDLTRLQQIGTGKDYKKQFSRLLARVGFMTEAQRISSYVCGLKEGIHIEVKSRKLATLEDAKEFSLLFEHCSKYWSKSTSSAKDTSMPPVLKGSYSLTDTKSGKRFEGSTKRMRFSNFKSGKSRAYVLNVMRNIQRVTNLKNCS